MTSKKSDIDFQSRIMADERAELREGQDFESLKEYEEWLDSILPTEDEVDEMLKEMYRNSG